MERFFDQHPELKEYQNQIAMLEQKYPNYLSLFLQDITNQDELGKQRFWGKKWNVFQQRAKALLADQTTDLVHKEQEFSKLFDAWIPLQIEQWRGEVDRDRVAQKKQKLFAFYQQYGGENRNPNLRNQQYEQLAQAGTLTMEIFLDDVLARLTPQLTKIPLVNLYQQWESQKIQQISKKNQTFEAFYQTLKLSSTNNDELKAIAQKQKAELFTKKLTPEAFKKEAYAIDQQWHRIARESYGMLNREEVIRSAFVNIKESDYKGYGILLKKIQTIGKIYYGDQKVAVDGFWGPDTQAVVLSLRQKEELQSIRPALDRILAANEDFGLKAQERSKKLTENQVPGLFDKAQQAFSSSLSAQEITSEKGKEEKSDHKPQKTHLNTALEEMSSEEVESCIPRADYLQALETFLKAQQLPMSLKSDPLLADNILKGTGSGEEYEAVVQLWNQSQTKAQLLIAWKANLQAKITQEAQQSVQKAVNTTLKSFGIELGPQELHAIAQGKISEFTDPLHSELHYRFDPATGEFSLKNGVLLEEKAKKLSLNTNRFNPLFKIPTIREFTDKAADLQSYLPHQRPQDKENFEKDLQQSLQERIRYQMGTVEKQTLSEHLQNEQMKSSCIQELKQLLDLPAEGEISLERNPAYYEMLFPILLTLEKRTENAELHQLLDLLKTIRSFVRSDQQSFANEESRQQYDRNNPILGVLSDFDVKNDLKIHGNQKRKADFALGVFF